MEEAASYLITRGKIRTNLNFLVVPCSSGSSMPIVENIGLTVDCLDQADTTYTYQNSELEKTILNLGHKQFDILFSTRSSVSI